VYLYLPAYLPACRRRRASECTMCITHIILANRMRQSRSYIYVCMVFKRVYGFRYNIIIIYYCTTDVCAYGIGTLNMYARAQSVSNNTPVKGLINILFQYLFINGRPPPPLTAPINIRYKCVY